MLGHQRRQYLNAALHEPIVDTALGIGVKLEQYLAHHTNLRAVLVLTDGIEVACRLTKRGIEAVGVVVLYSLA